MVDGDGALWYCITVCTVLFTSIEYIDIDIDIDIDISVYLYLA